MIVLDATSPGDIELLNPRSTTVREDWSLIPTHRPPTLGSDFALYLRQVELPRPQPRVAPRLERAIADIRSWTGWTVRGLADAAGTSHPTILAIGSGRTTTFSRIPDVPRRIVALHELLTRLHLLAGDDPVEINRALRDRPAGQHQSALEALAGGDLPGAYLCALDVLSPPRTAGMMRGRFPARPGAGTTSLTD
ncbi:MAG: hypothetical protein ACYDAG_01490 [Chloroflexota bacterium]